VTREKRRPLKVGVERLSPGQGATAVRWGDISLMARRAEVGFDSIWIEDHLLFRHEG
jgi:alkanesulfonate monooxygenase SsuD/methylene tetrahydromethanopterin reductase-like flavin-dependent oxidoreductase (luciferase family)